MKKVKKSVSLACLLFFFASMANHIIFELSVSDITSENLLYLSTSLIIINALYLIATEDIKKG